MIYFDTSFLVPLILPEHASDSIAAFIGKLPAEQFTISHWTRVEFSSLIAREVRMGGLDAHAAARANARFETMVAESFTILLPTQDDFGLAREYLGRVEPVCVQVTRCISRSAATTGGHDLQPGQAVAKGRPNPRCAGCLGHLGALTHLSGADGEITLLRPMP